MIGKRMPYCMDLPPVPKAKGHSEWLDVSLLALQQWRNGPATARWLEDDILAMAGDLVVIMKAALDNVWSALSIEQPARWTPRHADI